MKAVKIAPPSPSVIRSLQRRGVTHIKVELEANLSRNNSEENGYYCDDCDDGWQECERDHTCRTCDGYGRVCILADETTAVSLCRPELHREGCTEEACDSEWCSDCSGEGTFECDCDDLRCQNCEDGWVSTEGDGVAMTDEYCQTFIENSVSAEARAALVFGQFYYDGSVDSEYTFTIPINKVVYLPEFIRAFGALAEQTGHIDTRRAGMHISVLWGNGEYPVTSATLDSAKLTNFRREVKKLLPALFFLGSADWRSRDVTPFRMPKIDIEKYSAIHILTGGFEFRVFETCYDRPEMIYQFVEVIANCLKFYSTSAKIKAKLFNKFVFPERGQYVARFFETPEALEALDSGLAYLKPAGTPIELLKRQRNFRPNYDALRREAKLRKQYIQFCSEVAEQRDRRIRRDIRSLFQQAHDPALRTLFNLELDKSKYALAKAEITRRYESEYRTVNYEAWLKSYKINGVSING